MKEGPQTNQGRLYAWGKRILGDKINSQGYKDNGGGGESLYFHHLYNHHNQVSQDVYGYGSNKFGQLGLPDLTSENELKKLNFVIGSNKLMVQSVFCGAEHTFFITGNFLSLTRR